MKGVALLTEQHRNKKKCQTIRVRSGCRHSSFMQYLYYAGSSLFSVIQHSVISQFSRYKHKIQFVYYNQHLPNLALTQIISKTFRTILCEALLRTTDCWIFSLGNCNHQKANFRDLHTCEDLRHVPKGIQFNLLRQNTYNNPEYLYVQTSGF